jgi:plasmid maintenance system antidote protein VapI
MAYRIEAVFGGSMDLWTRLQMNYQNWLAAEKIRNLKLKKYTPSSGQHGHV